MFVEQYVYNGGVTQTSKGLGATVADKGQATGGKQTNAGAGINHIFATSALSVLSREGPELPYLLKKKSIDRPSNAFPSTLDSALGSSVLF